MTTDVAQNPWGLMTALRVRLDEIVAYRTFASMPGQTFVWLRGVSERRAEAATAAYQRLMQEEGERA